MNIVVLDGFTLNPGDLTWSGMERYGRVAVFERTPAELIVERAMEAEIVLTNKTPLREDVLSRLPRLKYIGVLATGYDVVDVRAAAERGVVVTNIPAYGTDSVAQMVFALLLELCHRAGDHSESVRRGEWTRSLDWCYWRSPIVELAGKTIGIVGYGRIGSQVAEIASAFGMKVAANSQSRRQEPRGRDFRWMDVPELLAASDVVSLHCPLTAQTEGMINAASLSTMKREAFLINTARGKLIREADLADALNAGTIAGAAMDVLSVEPPDESNPLLAARNCVITPHIAWASKEARTRLMNMAVDNVRAFLEGDPANVVSR